jgi:hypothetical protein
MNKGDFLLEKVTNMSKWLDEHLDLGLVDQAHGIQAVHATLLASGVGSKVQIAAKRDWDGLLDVIATEAPVLLQAATMVRERPALHAKFWRYIDLFVEITKQ